MIRPTRPPPGVVHHPSITLGAPFRAPIDQKCKQDNQILLSRTFYGERGEQSIEIYHLFTAPDFSCLFPLLGWYITHPSPQGSLLEPQSDQKCNQDNQILLSRTFLGDRGEQSPEIYHLFSPDFSHRSPHLGGASPMHHPRAPLQSPKMTKNTIKITRSCLAGLFIREEGNNYLENLSPARSF